MPGRRQLHRRGLGRDPEAETLIYLRTALDPAPVVTKAREFQGLLDAATRWLRRQGVGPHVVSLLAADCPASSVLYWAAMSSASIQPLNLLFTREAIAAQLNAAKAKILFTPPPSSPGGLYEKSEELRELAPNLERVVVLPLDGRVAFGDETLAPSDDLDNADVSTPAGSSRCCRPVVRPGLPRLFRSATGTSSPPRSAQCSRSI